MRFILQLLLLLLALGRLRQQLRQALSPGGGLEGVRARFQEAYGEESPKGGL